jgi:hypothetical protein
MQIALKRSLLCGAVFLSVVCASLALWFGVRAFKSVTVRQPNAYAMQAVGELIVEHMRLHSGAWPRSWKDLQNTCAVIGRGVFSTNADAEIEKLKKLIDVDWAADPEALRRVVIKGNPISVVRLRSGRRDWFIGAGPNEIIAEYLKRTTEPGRAANGSQPSRPDVNSTPLAAGSRR